jgi:hypothetical protein
VLVNSCAQVTVDIRELSSLRVRRFLLLSSVLLLAACQQAPAPELGGRLYFASGNYVGEFDIAQGTSVIVGNRGAATVRNVSGFGHGRLLLAETVVVDGHDVQRISWIDLESGRAQTLYSGVVAHYLDAAAALLWDDGTTLHVTGRNRNSDINAEVMSHGLNQLSAIIGASGQMVLFEVGLPENRVIYSYDVGTRELLLRNELSTACRLVGAVWITDREQLACPAKEQGDGRSEYLLVGLDGAAGGRLALPEGKQFHALAWSDDLDTLFLAERWHSLWGAERFSVWSYDFTSGRAFRIVRNQYLGNSAVFAQD